MLKMYFQVAKKPNKIVRKKICRLACEKTGFKSRVDIP